MVAVAAAAVALVRGKVVEVVAAAVALIRGKVVEVVAAAVALIRGKVVESKQNSHILNTSQIRTSLCSTNFQ